MTNKIKYLCAVVGGALLPWGVFAAESAGEYEDIISGPAEYLIFVLFIVALGVLIGVLRKFGSSILGKLFTYFLLGTVVLLSTRVFVALVESGVISIGEGSLEVWWHVLFYVALVLYLVGLRALAKFSLTGEPPSAVASLSGWSIVAGGSIVVVMFAASLSDRVFSEFYVGSALDNFGLHHFLAFALAAFVSIYLFRVRDLIGKIGQGIAVPFFIAIMFLSIQHFWELLTESWKVLELSKADIEHVEQLFVIISVFCMIWTYVRLKSATQAPKSASAQP